MTTTAPATLGDFEFDPYDYDFQEDPYPTYAALRAQDPLHYSARHDLWVLSRYADIHRAVRDDDTFSNAMGVSIDASAWGPHAYKTMSFLAMDPPHQTRLRKLVSKGFTPRRVQELVPRIEELTKHYLDQALASAGEGWFDWIGEVAGKLPMDVISQMMGVPEADRDEVRRLADLVVHREEGVYDVPQAGAEAAMELIAYYQDMVSERRARPGEDLTSALLAAQTEGDQLTDEEVIAFLFLMVVAGNETTTKLLGNALAHLTAHPQQHHDVFGGGADAELVSPWIEETLRFDNSTQMLARSLRSDVELHGRRAPAGSKLILALGSGNRDEQVFSRPGEFDIHRDPQEVAQLLSFGGGRHFCLGANLARLEARIALTELVRRVGSVEVDHERAVRVHSVNVRGFAELPVRMTTR